MVSACCVRVAMRNRNRARGTYLEMAPAEALPIQHRVLGETAMDITLFSPLVAILSGITILIWPRLLNYIVAFYLILFGLMELILRMQMTI